jgi:hypothetical protein
VLEPYREQAHVVGKLRGKAGAEFTLYQLCDASALECSGGPVSPWTSNTGP